MSRCGQNKVSFSPGAAAGRRRPQEPGDVARSWTYSPDRWQEPLQVWCHLTLTYYPKGRDLINTGMKPIRESLARRRDVAGGDRPAAPENHLEEDLDLRPRSDRTTFHKGGVRVICVVGM